MTAPDDDQLFYSPKEIAALCRMDYENVLGWIEDGTIPSEKFGSRRKVPARWVRERLGSPEPVLRVVPEPAPVVTPDYGPLASVLEILGTAMVQAAGALRGAS